MKREEYKRLRHKARYLGFLAEQFGEWSTTKETALYAQAAKLWERLPKVEACGYWRYSPELMARLRAYRLRKEDERRKHNGLYGLPPFGNLNCRSVLSPPIVGKAKAPWDY